MIKIKIKITTTFSILVMLATMLVLTTLFWEVKNIFCFYLVFVADVIEKLNFSTFVQKRHHYTRTDKRFVELVKLSNCEMYGSLSIIFREELSLKNCKISGWRLKSANFKPPSLCKHSIHREFFFALFPSRATRASRSPRFRLCLPKIRKIKSHLFFRLGSSSLGQLILRCSFNVQGYFCTPLSETESLIC